jgi:PAS domain S-box-containing protein
MILNVDDYDPGRYARTQVLRQAGFDVREAATGAEALTAVARDQPEVVILDVNLPDVSGLEVCRRLKTDPATSTTPVLHLSATFVGPGHRVAGLEGGADAYLTDPVEPPVLIATVNALLRMRRAEKAIRAAARRWQTTFDSINDGVALLDVAGMVMQCNAAFAGIFGRPAADVEHRSIHALWQEGTGLTEECPFVRLVRHHVREIVEAWMGDRWMRITADPVVEGTTLLGAVYIVTDVTERKRVDEERALLLARERAARAEAESASRAKDEFLATISHELRAPLNAIMGWTRLMRTERLDETARGQALETIERNVRLQTQLIEDLLDVSRIISGRLRLELRPVALAAVIEAAVDSVRPAATAKQIRLVLALDHTLPARLVDSDRIQQVVWNLLANAVKFTPRGGTVEVRLEQDDAGARILVRDTGQGISPEFLPYVFDRFRQAETSTNRSHSGLGLGLAIVRHLVELHGGTVHAESLGEGKGATFTVLLPGTTAEPESATGANARRRADPAGPSARLDGARAIVVDDNADARGLLSAVLQSAGAVVTAVGSAREALAALPAGAFDVLLSDIGMPGEDGYAMIRAIRQLPAERGGAVPAVALTGYASPRDQGEALAAGYQVHVSKPVDPAVLLVTVARLLGRR